MNKQDIVFTIGTLKSRLHFINNLVSENKFKLAIEYLKTVEESIEKITKELQDEVK